MLTTNRVAIARKYKLIKESDDLVELDMTSPHEYKQSVGLLVAFRPWVFSLFAPQKKR